MIILPKKVPEPGFYYHYKHDPKGPVNESAYKFLGIIFHTEEDGVHFIDYLPLYESAGVYQASKELGVSCRDGRPLEMWMGDVVVDGVTMKRFTKITDPAVIAELEKICAKMYP